MLRSRKGRSGSTGRGPNRTLGPNRTFSCDESMLACSTPVPNHHASAPSTPSSTPSWSKVKQKLRMRFRSKSTASDESIQKDGRVIRDDPEDRSRSAIQKDEGHYRSAASVFRPQDFLQTNQDLNLLAKPDFLSSPPASLPTSELSRCPSCRRAYDQNHRRKLIDSCGHARCYECLFREDKCSVCARNSSKFRRSKFRNSLSLIHEGPRPERPLQRGFSCDVHPTACSTFPESNGSHESGFQSSTSLSDSPSCSVISLISSTRSQHAFSRNSNRHSIGSFAGRPESSLSQRSSLYRRSICISADQCPIIEAVEENNSCCDEDLKIYEPTPSDLFVSLKPLFFEVPAADDGPFIGRQWLFREIIEQLSFNRGIMIEGQPGSGKTSVCLELIRFSCFSEKADSLIPSSHRSPHSSVNALASEIVSFHLCQADNAATCLPGEFVHSLAAHLVRAPTLEPYRHLVHTDKQLQQTLDLSSCIANPSKSLISGILDPLKALHLDFRRCLIVIDGVCEAEVHRSEDGHSLGSFLAAHLDEFPTWLKVIVTVKNVEESKIKGMQLHNISLSNGNDARIQRDIREFTRHRLRQSVPLQINVTPTKWTSDQDPLICFVESLCQLTSGSFLFAKATLDHLEAGNLVVKSANFNVLPLSLSECFQLECNLLFNNQDAFAKVKTIFEVVIASLHPLTVDEIIDCVAALERTGTFRDNTRDTWNNRNNQDNPNPQDTWDTRDNTRDTRDTPLDTRDSLRSRFNALSRFLPVRSDGSVMFRHSTFRDWLCRHSDKFHCNAKTGHAAIALRMCRTGGPVGPEKTLELCHHLLKANLFKDVRSDIPPRDLQATLVSSVSHSVSQSLCSLRNITSPNIFVSRLLLLAGASPDVVTSYLDEAPLLGIFAHRGHGQMVALLLEFSANVQKVNAKGKTALMLAAEKGYAHVVRILLAHGAEVGLVRGPRSVRFMRSESERRLDLGSSDGQRSDLESNDGRRQENGRMASDDRLSSDGRSSTNDQMPTSGFPNEQKSDGQTSDEQMSDEQTSALGSAVENEHQNVVDILLTEVKVPPEVIQQAMVVAARVGNVEILESLTEALEEETGLDASLVEAATHGHAGVVRFLIQAGADPNGGDGLHAAARHGHWSVVELLLQAGCDRERRNGAGETAGMIAAAEGHVGILELLGSPGEAKDGRGRTAAMLAARNNKIQTFRQLVKDSAEVNAADGKINSGNLNYADADGRTLLHHAASAPNDEMVTALLEMGASMDAVDAEEKRPIDVAVEREDIRCIACFLKRGAKLGPKTWSIAKARPKIILVLLNKVLEDGNTLFKRGRYPEASHRYKYALKRIPADQDLQLATQRLAFHQLRIHLMLNLSRSERKQGRNAEACDAATGVIALCKATGQATGLQAMARPSGQALETYREAYQARAKAHKEMGRFEEAVTDLSQALKLAPQNRELHLLLKEAKAMQKQAG